jgi:hypothetical protein
VHRNDDETVGHHAHHDARHAGQHLGGETNELAQPAAPALGQKHAGTDADRQPEQTTEAHHEQRADYCIADSTAGLPHRRRQAGEESQGKRMNPF